MQVITYSLRNDQARSDQYYRDVDAFTDEVLTEAQDRLGPMVRAFRSYLEATGRETPRTDPEYVFEILTLGVLWRVYAGKALGLALAPRRALTALARLRERIGLLKPGADLARGVLATLFLFPGDGRQAGAPAPTLAHLDRLLDWLAATGDLEQEVKRLRAWRDFMGQQPDTAAERLAKAIAFAGWFETHSATALGRYTPHVERFLSETHPSYRWREDVFFVSRQRVEYHLNMVGTTVLNRAFRQAFLATKRKLVLVPPCMKARPDGECQARATSFGASCAGCTPGCRVRQVTELGREHGFQVLMLPDELSVFSGGTKPVEGDAVGVVGVSCVLTNPSGGWETRNLGVPAQGVLLDYCGCSYHWHETGIPTDINADQLLDVLGIGTGSSCEENP